MSTPNRGARCAAAALVLLTSIPAALSAAEPAATATGTAPVELWEPPPPPPSSRFDWVQLPSGEWLAGDLGVLYEDSLDFDSEELGEQSIDWEDVKQLRTRHAFIVRANGGRQALGRVILENDQLQVVGTRSVTYPKTAVFAIAAGQEREVDLWAATASVGLNVQSGNTDQQNLNVRASAMRRTVQQRMVFDYASNFSETERVQDTNNHRLNANWDRFVTERLFWSPLFGEYYKDPFRNIAHRVTVGGGLGYQLIDTTRTELRISAGPAYQRIWYQDVGAEESDSESSPAFVGEFRFSHEITDDIDFNYDYRFQLTNESNGRYNHHMETGISIDLIGDLDLSVTYVWDLVEAPQPDEDGVVPEPDDFQLLVNIGYSF